VVRLFIGAALVYFWPSPGPALLAYLIALFVTLAFTPRQLGGLKSSAHAGTHQERAARSPSAKTNLLFISASSATKAS